MLHVGVGTYAGEAARPYVAAAIMSADTLANGYISVQLKTFIRESGSPKVLRSCQLQLNDYL